MLELLNQLDHWAFLWINRSLGNPIFDALLPFCREKLFWSPLYLFIVSFLVLNFQKKGWVLVLGLCFSVGLADFTSSTLIKYQVARLRPCNEPEFSAHVDLRIESCGGGYSFTSSHAANHFAAAVFLGGILGAFFTRARLFLLLWAGLIAFSQVYVGVHFPGDVLCGALLGAAIGWWTLRTWQKYIVK